MQISQPLPVIGSKEPEHFHDFSFSLLRGVDSPTVLLLLLHALTFRVTLLLIAYCSPSPRTVMYTVNATNCPRFLRSSPHLVRSCALLRVGVNLRKFYSSTSTGCSSICWCWYLAYPPTLTIHRFSVTIDSFTTNRTELREKITSLALRYLTRLQTPWNDTFFLHFFAICSRIVRITPRWSWCHTTSSGHWDSLPPTLLYTFSIALFFHPFFSSFSKIPEKRQKGDSFLHQHQIQIIHTRGFSRIRSLFFPLPVDSGTMGTKIDFPLPRNRKISSSRTHPLFAHCWAAGSILWLHWATTALHSPATRSRNWEFWLSTVRLTINLGKKIP